ncbi:MAG TPA: phage tail tip lysozyme [Candidatus Saccharimonadaceae bacterium]|nr:phage tail tip lysozyme [Candidatus Saccharimonadaceae bacterium]
MKRLILYLCVVVVAVSGVAAQNVLGIDVQFNSTNRIDVFNPDESGICIAKAGANNDDSKSASYEFFVSKGLSSEASSAILGGLIQKSELKPKIVNPETNAYGIAQWQGERRENLLAKPFYQQESPEEAEELAVQLDFVWEELEGTESAALETLNDATDNNVEEKTVQFGQAYGLFEEGGEGKSAEYAESVLKQYGDAGTQEDCAVTGAGDFVYYSQKDERWATYPYGDAGTIGPAGCGPTSMAMIVATLVNKNVTPKEVADAGAANGSSFSGGTIHYPMMEAASQKWGIKYEDITGRSLDTAIEVIKEGGLVYMGGQGPAPFTSGGHVVVMRGVTSDGKIIIGDPYRNAADVYSYETIDSYRGSTFAITKG